MDRAWHRLRQFATVAGQAAGALLGAVPLAAALRSSAAANSRIKDVADFAGGRDNLLVGYGLVVGRRGIGDSLRNSAFTAGTLEAELERLGVASPGPGSEGQKHGRGHGHRDAAAVCPPGLAAGRLNVRISQVAVAQGNLAVRVTGSSGKPASVEMLRGVAQEFEAVFLAQVLARINQPLGSAEDNGETVDQGIFHDMFDDEIAKLISRSGGVGVADAALNEMLKAQELA